LAATRRGMERGSSSGRMAIASLLSLRSTSRELGIAADQGEGGIIGQECGHGAGATSGGRDDKKPYRRE
jgi:hypothetical protein